MGAFSKQLQNILLGPIEGAVPVTNSGSPKDSGQERGLTFCLGCIGLGTWISSNYHEEIHNFAHNARIVETVFTHRWPVNETIKAIEFYNNFQNFKNNLANAYNSQLFFKKIHN